MKYSDNNAYIELVDKDNDIFVQDDVYQYKGEWASYFWNTNDICLEIGTGLGNFFSDESSKNPDKNYIWMEIRYKRLYKTAEKSRDKWANNFVLLKDFAQNIDQIFWKWEIVCIYIFFPDPWDKKDRQRKHRLLQKPFIESMYNVLKLWWKIVFKTDHREYFDSTLDIFSEVSWFEMFKKSYDYEKELLEFDKKNMTEFEHIFREHKIKINYVEFVKK